MAPSEENDDDRNDTVSSDRITEETTAIPSLPFEIIEEILFKLPVKFLMQFKSVCKSWKSLISDSNFAKKHLRVSTTRHHVLVTYTTNRLSHEFVFVDYPLSSVFTELTAANFPLPTGNRLEYIVGSCHGIICFELDQQDFALWNPSISKFMKLPSLAIPNQEICYTAYGFGYVYDNFNDNYTYKVVAVNHIESDNDVIYKIQLKVYTLGTDSWRVVEDFPYGIPLGQSSGIFVSGTVNWLDYNEVIVSLDLDDESYQEITQPDYGVGRLEVTLVVLRDCLSILAQNNTFSDIWLMDEYGNAESWTKLFRIPHSHITPIYLYEDGRLLLVRQSERSYSELAIYNSRDSTLKTTEIQKINCLVFNEFEVYQESLITPCS